MMSEKRFTILSDRSVLQISGDDAVSFLQGLVSNDVNKLSPRNAIYCAFLTAQGKYLHDFFITNLGTNLYLDCEASRISDLIRRLNIYKLRSRVDIKINDTFQILALFGERALNTLGLPKTVGAAKKFETGIVYTDPRLDAAGARCMITKDTTSKVIAKGFVEVNIEFYQRHRMALGLPDSSRDMQVEKSTLLESGFEELNGVDFKKGCYMGQELTARTKYRGLVKKRLIPISINGETPLPGEAIKQEGKHVGELRSFSGNIGMALIRLEALQNEASLTVGKSLVIPQKPDWANF